MHFTLLERDLERERKAIEKERQRERYRETHTHTHGTGEAFIGQEKYSVIMASGLRLRKVYFITTYQIKKFSPSKFFKNAVKCCKKP